MSAGTVLLREWMDEEKKTQVDVAKLVGVSQGAVCQWLAGRVPKTVFALKLAALAGIPLESWGEPVNKPKTKTKRKAA